MFGTHRLTMIGSVALLMLIALVAAPVRARDATYSGTVASVAKAKIQVLTDDSDAKKTVWFAVTEKTKVTRDGKIVAFDAADIKVGERLSVTVATGDEEHTDWTCSMHPEVSVREPGKCPLCNMALKERTVPAKAATIRVDQR